MIFFSRNRTAAIPAGIFCRCNMQRNKKRQKTGISRPLQQAFDNLRISYGFNSNFLTGFRISQAKHTSDTVLIAESATDLDTTPGGYYFCYSWAMDVSPWPYHGMQCNIAWLDGHASSVTSPTGVPGTKSASRGLYQENVLGNKFTVRNKWDPLR